MNIVFLEYYILYIYFNMRITIIYNQQMMFRFLLWLVIFKNKGLNKLFE